MQEKLCHFIRNNMDLVSRIEDVNVTDTKLLFKNKSNEYGNVTRNNARLVSQGYTKIKGVNFDKSFAPVARLESIRLLLGI